MDGYSTPNFQNEHSIQLVAGLYEFNIFDTNGDGLCCAFGRFAPISLRTLLTCLLAEPSTSPATYSLTFLTLILTLTLTQRLVHGHFWRHRHRNGL